MSFVSHTHLVNRKLFRKNMETSTNILLLVKREEQVRLMSIRSKPWFKSEEDAEEIDLFQDQVYLFSGILTSPEELDEEKSNLYARRFAADKMRSIQLISKTIDGVQNFVFVVQYNCSIISLSLNDPKQVNLLCDTRLMIRRHLARGHND